MTDPCTHGPDCQRCELLAWLDTATTADIAARIDEAETNAEFLRSQHARAMRRLAATGTEQGAIDEAVQMLTTIGLDITYEPEGLAIIARQIVGMGVNAGRTTARTVVAALTCPDADTSSSYIAGVADGYRTAIQHAVKAIEEATR